MGGRDNVRRRGFREGEPITVDGIEIPLLGFGTYMAVDVALVVDILPSEQDAAKDLGVINIANNVPQMLAPIINVFLIGICGYALLFPWAIALVILSAFLVYRIRGVR